jgi:hypothetical protein
MSLSSGCLNYRFAGEMDSWAVLSGERPRNNDVIWISVGVQGIVFSGLWLSVIRAHGRRAMERSSTCPA